jgi:MYXO-CTERM domain-containing protein
MNKFVISMAATAALAVSAFASDGTGTITTGTYTSLPGGEFTITTLTGNLGRAGMAADINLVTFQTFCVEVNEHFAPGSTHYSMTINNVAIFGGSGGPSYPLDPRTAFLYWNFRNGTLAGYNYTNASSRRSSAAALQAAIWYLQGNQSGGANNGFVALANNAVGSGAWSGIGDVRILNVYYPDGSRAQDQLTIVPHPLPTPGAAALAGAGLLAAGRRRRA